MEVTKKSVTTNMFWRFLERCGAQLVTFIVSIVLARLLDPTIYGTVALVTVFTTILQVFVDGGLGNALVQKKDADDLDFSTVFFFNIGMCAILYLGIFFCAPLIAAFYNKPELTLLTRVLAVVILISGIKNVQIAYVSKNLQFKKFFWATLVGTIIASVAGIVMAFFLPYNLKIWALVAQNLINQTIDTIVLWFLVKWRPKLLFSWKRFSKLFSYGWKLLLSGLLDTGYNELRSLIIGKKYSSADLGYYNRGRQFPNLIVQNVNSSIDSVLLPSMSFRQDDKEKVKSMTRRSIKVSSYIMLPMMAGLAAVAPSLVHVLLTDKWLPCVIFLQISCLSFAFWPIFTANLNAIKALGKSDIFLILEIIKKVLGLMILFSFMWISVEAIAFSSVLITVISLIINTWPNKKLLNYSLLEQIKDILPSLALSLVMGIIVYSFGVFAGMSLKTLLIQVFFGVSIYLFGSAFFKIEPYFYTKEVIGLFINKSNKGKK